ncbi:hypothetical protein EON65_24785 [archaeon]|nr:MAG: hypothetical protein EON65_24785 [archaeon]
MVYDRHASELAKHHDLIEIVQSSIQSNTTLSSLEQEKYTILRGRLEALDRAVRQAEDTVFLFEKY